MDRQQARNLIKETFEKPFEKARFSTFIKNLLNRSEDAPFTYKGQYIPDAYKPSISTLERIAKFTDGEQKVDVLIIRLRKESSLERARTMQRNFVAWYLNGSRGGELKDAALVAFVSPDETDWRFSLVKMDYKFEQTTTGKMKVKEEFTPARRWSFLVGISEKSHTAQSRLINILANDEQSPSLTELEESFNIETVTNEFFLKYRDLFVRAKEALDKVVQNDSRIKADFEAIGVNTVDFAKKLLGQIIFLYFLQKKGWFGVKGNDKWGDGSKQFLRELFEGKHGTYKNFFNDILEPLFYDALSRDRSDIDHWNDHFKCKIPFLNGGLFDPIGNYSWHNADILLPNELFSNRKAQMGEGNGILDIFDLYNFTVKEDEPMEKEVAIDPELLGKAYEKFNAIRPDNFEEYKKALTSGKKGDESKFNKQFGVYYTPREIVHYMCQQGLINYLTTEMAGSEGNKFISKSDIETLIHLGEQVGENEARVESHGTETSAYSYKLPESIRENAELIDRKLAGITVCDPAVGSGAFPVGMMSEIVKARNALSIFIQDEERTVYDFKRRCIQHSLYGVDIDPGAVEIAKLRLWLSLVVDEDDIRQIKPLPNLDYKIMQGNSLLEEFEGVKLFDEKLIASIGFDKEKRIKSLKERQSSLQKEYFELHSQNMLSGSKQSVLEQELKKISLTLKKIAATTKPVFANPGLFDAVSEAQHKASQLKLLHKELFETTDKKKKDDIKKTIGRLEWELIEVTLKEEGKSSELKKIEEFKKSNIKPFFLWKLNFTEVFQEKGGFDIVIANPPYVRQEQIGDIKPSLKRIYSSYSGRADLYVYFYEMATCSLLSKRGTLCFISSNKWLRAQYGEGLRRILSSACRPNTLIDFGELPVFEEAATFPLIFIGARGNSSDLTFVQIRSLTPPYPNLPLIVSTEGMKISSGKLSHLTWSFGNSSEEGLLAKLRTFPGRLDDSMIMAGIKTGFNTAFWIDAFCREQLITLSPSCSKFLKPLIIGDDIRQWEIGNRNRWIIYTPIGTNPKELGSILIHLEKWKLKLQGRALSQQWWELQQAQFRYCQLFESPKIVYPDIAKSPRFTIDYDGRYLDMTAFAIASESKFLVALLNSRLIWYFLQKTAAVLGDANNGGRLRLKRQYIKEIPIPKASTKVEYELQLLVEQILATKEKNKNGVIDILENKINQLVYQLYGLTKEEIRIVEGSYFDAS